MKGFWSEFRNFAVKGNALELAIAVVVGNAFSAIVTSLVNDLLTPLLGLATGSVDFKTLSVVLRPAQTLGATTAPALVLQYGAFVQSIINFFIIAFSIFIVFRLLSAARQRLFKAGEKATPPAQKPAQERLLEEIRDLLKQDGK